MRYLGREWHARISFRAIDQPVEWVGFLCFIVFGLGFSVVLACVSRHIVGRRLHQFMQTLGSMRSTDFKPIRDIAAVLYFGPVRLEIETAHALGDTE
jgi:hypothetical protein